MYKIAKTKEFPQINCLGRIAENNSTARRLEEQIYMQSPQCKNNLAAISFITLCLQAPRKTKQKTNQTAPCVWECVQERKRDRRVHVLQSPSCICQGFVASTAAKNFACRPRSRPQERGRLRASASDSTAAPPAGSGIRSQTTASLFVVS